MLSYHTDTTRVAWMENMHNAVAAISLLTGRVILFVLFRIYTKTLYKTNSFENKIPLYLYDFECSYRECLTAMIQADISVNSCYHIKPVNDFSGFVAKLFAV